MIDFSLCHLLSAILADFSSVCIHTSKKRSFLVARSKRRGEDVKRERVGSAVLLPFSPLTMGAFRRVIDRFRVPEPQEQASKEARLRFVTPPSKSIFSRSDTSIRTQRRFWNGYTRTTVRALSSNNRSVSTLTNFRELAIKGNEETGKSKCGVNIDGGYRRPEQL